jgi:hypothetical protein
MGVTGTFSFQTEIGIKDALYNPLAPFSKGEFKPLAATACGLVGKD